VRNLIPSHVLIPITNSNSSIHTLGWPVMQAWPAYMSMFTDLWMQMEFSSILSRVIYNLPLHFELLLRKFSNSDKRKSSNPESSAPKETSPVSTVVVSPKEHSYISVTMLQVPERISSTLLCPKRSCQEMNLDKVGAPKTNSVPNDIILELKCR